MSPSYTIQACCAILGVGLGLALTLPPHLVLVAVIGMVMVVFLFIGVVALMGYTVNAIVYTVLVMAIGMCVDYIVHFLHNVNPHKPEEVLATPLPESLPNGITVTTTADAKQYAIGQGPCNRRPSDLVKDQADELKTMAQKVELSLQMCGYDVFHGCMTAVLGVFLLGFASSTAWRMLSVLFMSIAIFGGAFALFVIPSYMMLMEDFSTWFARQCRGPGGNVAPPDAGAANVDVGGVCNARREKKHL